MSVFKEDKLIWGHQSYFQMPTEKILIKIYFFIEHGIQFDWYVFFFFLQYI